MNTIGGTLPLASLNSAFNSGSATIATSSQQIARDAQQTANPANPASAGSLVDLSQSSLLAQAGGDVVRTSNRMLGTLLDALA